MLNVCNEVIFLKTKDINRHKNKSIYLTILELCLFSLFLKFFLKTRRREAEFLQRNEKLRVDSTETNQFG